MGLTRSCNARFDFIFSTIGELEKERIRSRTDEIGCAIGIREIAGAEVDDEANVERTKEVDARRRRNDMAVNV